MGKPEAKSTSEEIVLSESEKNSLKIARELKLRESNCSKELQEVLKKYNSSLVVDPQSPIGNPSIRVQLLS